MTLTITNETGKEVVKMEIGEVDPVAAINAIANIPPPKPARKQRSDAGKPKTPATQS